MKDLHLHYSRTYGSISVTDNDGTTRQSSGRQMPAVLASMHDDDRAMLVAFCAAIIESCQGNQKRLVEW